MADRKSSDNPVLTSVADGDLFDVLDESEAVDSQKNKSISYRNLADQIISEVPSQVARHKAKFDSQITLTGSYQTVASSIDSEVATARGVLLRLTGVTYDDDTDTLNIFFQGSSDDLAWTNISAELNHRSAGNSELAFSLAYPVSTNFRYFRARVKATQGGGGIGLKLRNVTFEYSRLD